MIINSDRSLIFVTYSPSLGVFQFHTSTSLDQKRSGRRILRPTAQGVEFKCPKNSS